MKLHLGCGKKYIEGYKHVDLQKLAHVDYQTSVDKLDFASDNSIEVIYASHVLEHFGRHEYKAVLQEWYRVLQPYGILRIAVPSFDAVVEHYTQHNNLELLLGFLVGGQKVEEYDYHHMVFDEKLLIKVLKEIGFKEIRKYDWRTTDHAALDDFSQAYLPHMDKENGKLMSLNLEAVK